MPFLAALAPIAGTVGSVASIGSSLIGRLDSASDREKAELAFQQAMDEINKIGAPPDLSKEILFDKFKQVGVLTPQMEEAINVEFSNLANLKEKSDFRDAQTQALELLTKRGQTGLGPEDRAALNQIRSEVQRDAEAKRQQIIQNMQMRGQAGSGAELAASLIASQEGAQRQSEESDRAAAMASERALQAITSMGGLATQARGQEFDIESSKARAADELAQFNAVNAINRQTRNISNLNDAQKANLAEQQRITDTNTAMENAERLRQQEAQRQYWNDQLALAKTKSQARGQESQYYGEKAGDTSKMWGGIGSGVGSIFGAIAKDAAEKSTYNTPTSNPMVTKPATLPKYENDIGRVGSGVSSSIGALAGLKAGLKKDEDEE